MKGQKILHGLVEQSVTGAVDKIFKAKRRTAYINDLPDESFAYIEPGGKKDDANKTTPRSLRRLPFRHADGKSDLSHLRAALAFLPKSGLSDEAKKKAEGVLSKAAKEAKVGEYRKESLGEQKVVAASTGDGYDITGSYEELRNKIRDALVDAGQYGKYPSIAATFPKKIFIQSEDGRWFEIEYSIEADAVKLGAQRELEKKVEFVIKEWLEKLSGPEKDFHSMQEEELHRSQRIMAGIEQRPSLKVEVNEKELTEKQLRQRDLSSVVIFG